MAAHAHHSNEDRDVSSSGQFSRYCTVHFFPPLRRAFLNLSPFSGRVNGLEGHHQPNCAQIGAHLTSSYRKSD